jgi:hypothetical protein
MPAGKLHRCDVVKMKMKIAIVISTEYDRAPSSSSRTGRPVQFELLDN